MMGLKDVSEIGLSCPSLDLIPLNALKQRKTDILSQWNPILHDLAQLKQGSDYDLETCVGLIQSGGYKELQLLQMIQFFSLSFSNHLDHDPSALFIRQFALEQLTNTKSATLVNAFLDIYCHHYQPGSAQGRTLGVALASKAPLFSSPWRIMIRRYPRLLDPIYAHLDIAKAMQGMRSPHTVLSDQGFAHILNATLFDHVQTAFLEILKPHLNKTATIQTLFQWLIPQNADKRTRNAKSVIKALLEPWDNTSPPDPMRALLCENCLNLYGDPRLDPTHWIDVEPCEVERFRSWLTAEDLRVFGTVVNATQKNPQSEERRAFWWQLYRDGLIKNAWIAFSSDAYDYALNYVIQNTDQAAHRFAHQTQKRFNRQNTSLLFLEIGQKIVIDASHNYKTHIFDINDPKAPQLFRPSYDCETDIKAISHTNRSHLSTRSWENWVKLALK